MLQVATPAVFVGLVLLGACLISAWYMNRLQTNMTHILTDNVASLRASQQMEISLRQLRFHCFLYLIDPDSSLEEDIRHDHARFEFWLKRGEQAAFTDGERAYLKSVRDGYQRYREEFERLRKEAQRTGPRRDYRDLADANPLRHVIDPCQAYLKLNEEMMGQNERESLAVVHRLHGALLLIGLGGPIGGLLSGYGIARGLSRSLHQLSVRVRAVAEHLEQDVAAVSLSPDADLGGLDEQLQHVVTRVAEVGARMQRQHQEIIRAQQLAAVGQLAASVAHEVRNPLMAIKLLVEAALRRNNPRPFTEENLRIVHNEILRLEQTVQGFLDFARPPALRREPCDLRKVVNQAVDLIRARAQQQSVAVEVAMPDDPVPGAADSGQLCSVFVNLFINALDAMPRGGMLETNLRVVAFNNQVYITVSDTGPGIAPEMASKLFTPFASSKATGSGLGLSISRRIIEGHGGRIHVANRATRGACITVTLPVSPDWKPAGNGVSSVAP
jgi:signal transduction histidine kinase